MPIPMPMSMPGRNPIAENDYVVIRGRHLYRRSSVEQLNQQQNHNQQRRFYMTGIAFPTPPPPQPQTTTTTTTDSPSIAARRNPILDKLLHRGQQDANAADSSDPLLNLTGWNAVLDQLASEAPAINTVRVYEMDCRRDHGAFLDRAAELGLYVLVPLTARSGDGVLSRDEAAPRCYPRRLYDYGVQCLDRYWDHPSVLAGVVGNEVMNSLDSWQAAPCVRAFLDDMAAYGRHKASKVRKARKSGRGGQEQDGTIVTSRTEAMPLMYATQHDSPSAEFPTDDAMKLTLDYLACREGATATATTRSSGSGAGGVGSSHRSPFIFGVNIESWCSSLQTFEYEEDGLTESSYHSLWNTMRGGNLTKTTMDAVTGAKITVQIPRTISPLPASVPMVFSEMGCSRFSFNKDNDVTPKMVRDWKQIPLVSDGGPMSDVFSGFVAYGYDGGGNKYFRMMGGTNKWDGLNPLSSDSADFRNFRLQLREIGNNKTSNALNVGTDDGHGRAGTIPSCEDTLESIRTVWDIELRRQLRMPSYFDRDHRPWFPLLPSSNKGANTNQQLKLGPIWFQRDFSNSSLFDWGASMLVVLVVMVAALPLLKQNLSNRSQKRMSGNPGTLGEESVLLANSQERSVYV